MASLFSAAAGLPQAAMNYLGGMGDSLAHLPQNYANYGNTIGQYFHNLGQPSTPAAPGAPAAAGAPVAAPAPAPAPASDWQMPAMQPLPALPDAPPMLQPSARPAAPGFRFGAFR